jgi:hypothetical protein
VACVDFEKGTGAYRVLVGNPERRKVWMKRPFIRMSRCNDNIRMDVAHISWDGLDWIDLS